MSNPPTHSVMVAASLALLPCELRLNIIEMIPSLDLMPLIIAFESDWVVLAEIRHVVTGGTSIP